MHDDRSETKPWTRRYQKMDIAQMNNTFNICYIIIDTPNKESHFLKGSIFEEWKIDALKNINRLPISIPELFCSMEERASIRLSSVFPGRIIHFIKDATEIAELPYNFKVLITDTPQHRGDISDDVLLVSLETQEDLTTHIRTESMLDALRDFFLKNIKNMHPAYNGLHDNHTKRDAVIPLTKIRSHHSTFCNIEVLRAVGIEPVTSEADEKYDIRKDAEHSINLINKIRTEICIANPNELRIPSADYLITDFSIDLEYSINPKAYSKHALMKAGEVDYASIADSITFAKSTPPTIDDRSNRFKTEYYDELHFFSLINSIYTSSTLTPELKLGICNNDLFPITSSMGENIRSNNTKKLHKLMAKFTEKVIEKSDTALEYISNSTNKQIKVVSNLPLEWTNLNGLPLMIRHNTSRIFSTPGFIRESSLLQNDELALSLESFQKILIISSFPQGDVISQDIKRALEKAMSPKLSSEQERKLREAKENGAFTSDFEPEVVFRNINKKEELIEALNEFPYALVVFDMHGGHHSNSYGFLLLADGALNPQELSGVASIPPIVILSACDTSPADRNHYNVANAFLCAGAKTVLASTYPILSKDAAEYIARLYLRIKLYLPERISSVKRSIRWSEFITGLSRRIYFTDFAIHIMKKYKISNPSIKSAMIERISYTLEAAPHIFFEQILFDLSQLTGLSKSTLSLELTDHFTYSECMNYVQIGFPEKILIHASDLST